MDKKIIQKFIQLLGEKVTGKWVIMGGSVLPLLDASTRHTQDIDVAGPSKATLGESLALMEIAQTLGLPIEAVNQAAAFFLHKIPGWDKEIILIYKGPKAEIYRPSSGLYVLLKLNRLSETDLDDCIKMIQYAYGHKEFFDAKKVEKAIKNFIKKSEDTLRSNRLKKLLEFLH